MGGYVSSVWEVCSASDPDGRYLRAVDGPNRMLPIERFSFYDRAKKAYAIIQTGERRFYGCFAFRKGVIGPDGE